MDDEQLEPQDSLSPEGEQDTTPEVVEADPELLKAKEIADNQRIRAEKAERELKALKASPKSVEKEEIPVSGMGLKDIRALQDVPDEDVDEVIDFAKYKGISIAEAKKHPVIQTVLKTKAEERKSAEVANTGTSRRGVNKQTEETVLEDFTKGVVSEKKEDIEKLVLAQLAAKRKKG